MSTKTYTLIEKTETQTTFTSKPALLEYLNSDTLAHAVEETVAQQPLATQVIAFLDDPRFTLRKVDTVCEKFGFYHVSDLWDFLDENDIAYITRSKRGTGELLIGLASRN